MAIRTVDKAEIGSKGRVGNNPDPLPPPAIAIGNRVEI